MKTTTPMRGVLSNPGKVMYPKTGFTKKDVAEYYATISPVLLPHLAGRPITLKRYPDGVEGLFFYEKRCPAHRPEWVETIKVESTTHAEGLHHCSITDLSSLLWVVNIASLELHTLLSEADDLNRPTHLLFDLDPGPPAGLAECAEVAMHLRQVFEALGLKSYLKVSGGKGLHFAVPLNTPTTFDETKRFAHSIALLAEKQMPRLVVSKMQKARRTGKVLVDWSQNDHHKTTVAPYSLRAQPAPTVSAPITWNELDKFRDSKNAKLLRFEAGHMSERVKRHGDLYKAVLTLRQKLPRPDRAPVLAP